MNYCLDVRREFLNKYYVCVSTYAKLYDFKTIQGLHTYHGTRLDNLLHIVAFSTASIIRR